MWINLWIWLVFILDKAASAYKVLGYAMIAIYTFGSFYGKGKIDVETLTRLVDSPLVFWVVSVSICELVHNLMGLFGAQGQTFKKVIKLTSTPSVDNNH